MISWKTLPMGVAVLMNLLLAVAPAGAGDEWNLVFTEDFSDPACLTRWSLEGSAEASVTADGRLQIANRKARVEGESCQESTLWCRVPFWGDLRVEFDCRAEPKSRCLVFFNARTGDEQRNIFAWQRPLARYSDYAYEPRIELYSLGLLRSDQTELNLRHLGGRVPEEWRQIMAFPPQRFPARYLTAEELRAALASAGRAALPSDPAEVATLTRAGRFRELLAPHLARYEKVNAEFQEASIIARHHAQTPVFADSAKTYRVTITAVANRVTCAVDGRLILDHTDAPRASSPLQGGYIAFRNFVATTAWYDNLRVYLRNGPRR